MEIRFEMVIVVPDDHPVMNSHSPQRKVQDQIVEFVRDQDYGVTSSLSQVRD
jgi:hypothetical protein